MSRSHRVVRFGPQALLALMASALTAGSALAQTDPAPQALPYGQDFQALPHNSTVYPAGWQGWINGGPPGVAYLTSGPTADQSLLAPSSASTATGGIHNYDGKIGPLDNASNDYGLAFAINTTGGSAVTVDFDIMTIRNPYNGSSNTRVNEISLQYRVGTAGAWTTLPSTAYDNNTETQTGSGVTTPQKLESRSVVLPAACDHQPVVQLRWAQVGSGTGARPSFAVDNVVVQATGDNTPPSVAVLAPNGGESWAVGSGQTITWNASDAAGVASVDLVYSTDGGTTFPFTIALGEANDGSFAWTVPNTPTGAAVVRVTAHDLNANSASDVSDAVFSIARLTLSVTLAGTGSGSVSKDPDQPDYAFGQIVELIATPNTGSTFTGWSGDASGSANPLNVTMDANQSITATFAENSVVISQVYGGGGNTGATYTNDFIELFNQGPDPINVTGWTVQYASAAGVTWATTSLSGVIPAGRYYLVQQAAGAGGTVALPTPDAAGSIAMGANAGKVALVNGPTPLAGTCPSGATIEDLIGYGSASCSETSPAGTLSNTTAALRNSGGCDDTDNNAADVSVASPTPRNSASPANDCLFSLTVAADPPAGGSVAKSPDLPGYSHGSLVQLTATAASGYHFSNWSGDATGSTNPITVTMDSDKSVTAHFVLDTPSGGGIVISQVYGGGGNTGATYTNDYVELFNRGNTPVNVTGWTVQYASAAGGTWTGTTLIGTIPPGRYYLVQQAQGAGGTTPLPTPDAIGSITMSATDGKVALVNSGGLMSGTCPGGAGIVDLLGYGSASCSETSVAPGLSNPIASFRDNGGCDDTDNNAADFANGTPAPRNSATPFHLCAIWVDAGPEAATEFTLAPPVPNPSRGATRIPFALTAESRVRLQVVDVQGRLVASLVDGVLPAGRHEATWSVANGGGHVRPGLYFVRLEVRGQNLVRTVVLMQ